MDFLVVNGGDDGKAIEGLMLLLRFRPSEEIPGSAEKFNSHGVMCDFDDFDDFAISPFTLFCSLNLTMPAISCFGKHWL